MTEKGCFSWRFFQEAPCVLTNSCTPFSEKPGVLRFASGRNSLKKIINILEKGGEREKEMEGNIDLLPFTCAPTGDQTHACA